MTDNLAYKLRQIQKKSELKARNHKRAVTSLACLGLIVFGMAIQYRLEVFRPAVSAEQVKMEATVAHDLNEYRASEDKEAPAQARRSARKNVRRVGP